MRLHQPTNSPPPPAYSKKRKSWGRFVYIIVLLLIFSYAISWGIKKIGTIEAHGIIEGKKIIIQAPLSAKIEKINFKIGEKVNKNQEIVFLDKKDLQDKIKQQEMEINTLQRICEAEEKKLPLQIEEKNNELLLKQGRLKQNYQSLIGQTRQEQLRLNQLNDNLADQNQLKEKSKHLLKLNALTESQFIKIQKNSDKIKEEISRIKLRLESAEQELLQLKHNLKLIEKTNRLSPKHLKQKSPLPILSAKLAAAALKLKLLKNKINMRTIRSPATGIVTDIFKSPNEIVAAGQEIAEIVNPDTIYIKAFFDPKYQQELSKGNIVDLLFDNKQEAEGKIYKFYPATTPLPPQFQKTYQPHKRALCVEIQPVSQKTWPHTIGMGVTVTKKNWP